MNLFYNFILLIVKPFVIFAGKIGLPKRIITGKTYYEVRDKIDVGTVLLTKTKYEFSNLINPTDLKHAGIYVGQINNSKARYVLEAVGSGVVFTDLVTFLTTKDYLVISKPNFIRNKEAFEVQVKDAASKFEGIPYDYLFNKSKKAFYCFELAASVLKYVYSELQLECREIVKGKRIYDENTFLDDKFFKIVYDSRKV